MNQKPPMEAQGKICQASSRWREGGRRVRDLMRCDGSMQGAMRWKAEARQEHKKVVKRSRKRQQPYSKWVQTEQEQKNVIKEAENDSNSTAA